MWTCDFQNFFTHKFIAKILKKSLVGQSYSSPNGIIKQKDEAQKDFSDIKAE